MSRGLTPRQQQILQFMQGYIQDNGFPPSIREIGKAVGIKSLRGVTVHLDALKKKGYIERGTQPRTIRIDHPIYRPETNATMVPLLGSIAAGLACSLKRTLRRWCLCQVRWFATSETRFS